MRGAIGFGPGAFAAAFAAGFVSLVPPCVLPLVPGYLSAVSGVSLAEIQHGEKRMSRVLLPAIVFCLSFTVVFVALGMTASGIGSTLRDRISGAIRMPTYLKRRTTL